MCKALNMHMHLWSTLKHLHEICSRTLYCFVHMQWIAWFLLMTGTILCPSSIVWLPVAIWWLMQYLVIYLTFISWTEQGLVYFVQQNKAAKALLWHGCTNAATCGKEWSFFWQVWFWRVPKTARTSYMRVSVRCKDRGWCAGKILFSECCVWYLTRHTGLQYYQCMEHSPTNCLYCIYRFWMDFYNGRIIVWYLEM